MEMGSLKYLENTQQVIVLLLLLRKSHSCAEKVNVIGQSYGKEVNPTMKLDGMPEDGDQYMDLCVACAKKLLFHEEGLYGTH